MFCNIAIQLYIRVERNDFDRDQFVVLKCSQTTARPSITIITACAHAIVHTAAQCNLQTVFASPTPGHL